jgi:hypothetical protein
LRRFDPARLEKPIVSRSLIAAHEGTVFQFTYGELIGDSIVDTAIQLRSAPWQLAEFARVVKSNRRSLGG